MQLGQNLPISGFQLPSEVGAPIVAGGNVADVVANKDAVAAVAAQQVKAAIPAQQ